VTELERPIKQLLREPPVGADALWARIEAARSPDLRRNWLKVSSAHSRLAIGAPWARAVGFVGALGLAFVVAALAVIYFVPRAQLAWPLAKSADGPLARANGQFLSVLDTGDSGAALDIALSDGSHIHLDPHARLVTQRSDGHQFRAVIAQGKILFDVKPGGPRRWILDAGVARIEVIGTRFTIARSADRVTVSVEHGRVEVRGASVPEGAQTLGDGERLVVLQPLAASTPKLAAPPVGTPAAIDESAKVAPESPARAPRTPTAREPSADQLLKLADAARSRADYRAAQQLLQQFLGGYGEDSRAAIVALTLGRLQLDHLATPKAAAVSFAHADRLGLPDAVAEEGAARLVEAYAKSGEKELAAAAAARYRARFPAGPRNANVAAWLDLD
jgi:transmembrane sensor